MRYLAIFLLSLTLCGCASNDNDSTTTSSGEINEKCSLPANPYGSDSGHSAGYEWARDTGGDCGGSESESFNEGCSEYYAQVADYNNCAD